MYTSNSLSWVTFAVWVVRDPTRLPTGQVFPDKRLAIIALDLQLVGSETIEERVILLWVSMVDVDRVSDPSTGGEAAE